jgi:hypothetical protein
VHRHWDGASITGKCGVLLFGLPGFWLQIVGPFPLNEKLVQASERVCILGLVTLASIITIMSEANVVKEPGFNLLFQKVFPHFTLPSSQQGAASTVASPDVER